MTGGASFPGAVTEKLSGTQVPLSEKGTARPGSKPTLWLAVLGPLIVNWSKSSRS